MVCEKRPYLCAILVLCSFALFFHLVGYVAPGWLVMRRSVDDASLFPMKGQRIDDGGVRAPEPEDEPKAMFRRRRSDDDGVSTSGNGDDSTSEDDGDSVTDEVDSNSHHDGHHGGRSGHHGGHHGGRHGGRHGPKHDEENEMMKEKFGVESWMMKSMSEIKSFDVRTSYGLWYSVMCIHDRKMGGHYGDSDSEEKHMDMMSEKKHMDKRDDSSSDSDDDDDHRKGRHHCKKMSTKCALSYATIYEDFSTLPRHERRLTYSNFGNASLREHQIENSVVLACMVLGLISAIFGFKNVDGCRCARIACVVFMLLAAFIAIVPVARFSHYNISRCHQKSMVKVHAPYSVISTMIGTVFAFVSALVAGYASFKTRRNQPGKWYQFNNELETTNEEKKEKTGFYYSTDPLPVKPGLYDVCDFSNIKPVEEIKKPEVKEEEQDEFVM